MFPGPGEVGTSGRNLFHNPRFFNADASLVKTFRIHENHVIKFRAEAYNIFNHANLYVIGTSADVGASNTVNACFGCTGSPWDRRQLQFAARLLF